MLLRLPSNLHYPITILKVHARTGDAISLNENLFMYSYVSKVKVGQRNSDDEVEMDKKFVAHFQSTLAGTISVWYKWEGDVVDGPIDIIGVEEECVHAVQFSGMCTQCGKDMTETSPGGVENTSRATIQPLHDTQFLTISQEEAGKIDEEAKRRLLGSRKLSLVVDLDQTIIHAAVDPTIAEWQKDRDNPNHEAVKDVRAFQLIDEGPGMRGCWYYIKLRPGLHEFLEQVSKLYELHIYTMGTRQYAQQIANIVDPEKKYFGDRILSRDESGSMIAKNLERLFPVDTKMVVIIDDRGDVWKWSANLIRVTPFDFFVGIGDINSSFLPKKEEIQITAKAEEGEKPENSAESDNSDKVENGEPQVNGVIEESTSALEQLVAMTSDDPVVREMQSKGQEEVITTQLEEKPLLKMQQQQDEKDEINGETQPTESESSESESEASNKRKARHSILKDDDEELIHLEARLAAVHIAFFNEYDRKRLSAKGGRVAQLAGKRKVPVPEDDTDLNSVPDVKRVMPAMKLRVLQGVVIVFSGVLPLKTDIQAADISIWAKSFGARITDHVHNAGVTHVIAARVGTAKVKQAVKRGIKVVGTSWLIESIQQWRLLDEHPYLLEGVGQRGFSADLNSDPLDKTNLTTHDFLLSSSEGDSSSNENTADDDGPKRKKLKLNIDSTTREMKAGERGNYDDFVDDGSPITINQADWEDMDAELAEFMGSEVDSESDSESVVSRKAKKRRREDDSDEDFKSASDRISPKKGSALKSVAILTPSEGGSSNTTTPRPNNDSTPGNVNGGGGGGGGKEDNNIENDNADSDGSDDELARELERELEEAASAEEEEAAAAAVAAKTGD